MHTFLMGEIYLIQSIQNKLIAQTSGHSAARKISVSLAHGHAKRMAHSLESEESEEAGSGARKEERKTAREGRPSTLNLPQQVSASLARLPQSPEQTGRGARGGGGGGAGGRRKDRTSGQKSRRVAAAAAAQDKFPRLEGLPPASPLQGPARHLHWLKLPGN